MRTLHRAAGVLLLALVLAGCAQGNGGQANGNAGIAGLSGSPSAPAPSASSDGGSGGGGSGGNPSNPAPSYPSDAETYSKAAVTAYLNHDQTRLGQLNASGSTIFQTLASGNYDRNWALQNCQGAAGSSYCTFYNAVGDMLRLQLSNQLLGAAHAIVGGTFDPLTFPTDMKAYAQECLDAWKAGNSARVGYLTTPDAKTHLSAIADSHRADDWTFSDSQGAAGSSYLTWHNGSGDRIVFRFTNPGVDPNETQQHRIRDVLWNP
jgi:hypothetical protein